MTSKWWRAWISGLATAAVLLIAPAVSATEVPSGDIMIIAAHPDDDVITASGIIKQAVANDDTVFVAYLTNGDRCATPSQTPAHCSAVDPDIGDVRQDESVAALREVFDGSFGSSFNEDNMIFLGYPGGFLPYLRNNTPLPGDLAHTATYADRGLNHTDWHDTWKGAGSQHAPYTAAAISEDIYELLLAYQPDHIFTHSEFDRHSDHLSTYREVMEAVDEVQGDVPSYDPYIHTTIVHVAEPAVALSWPDDALDPTAFHVPIPELAVTSAGELLWDSRESFEVPASMQNPWAQNPKAQAVEAHDSQVDLEGGYIRHFVKRDEVFFLERLGNAEGIADSYTAVGVVPLNVGGTGVLANDVRGVLLGPDTYGPMTAVQVSGPAHASSFTLDSDGSFTYVHDGSANATDSFTYRPKQGSTNGSPATVIINVVLVDEDPTASNDGPYTVDNDAVLSVPAVNGVLSNDTDPESQTLYAALVADVSHGDLNLNLDGSFTYDHDGTLTTTDSFTYRAIDPGSNESNVATVSIVINPVPAVQATIVGSTPGAAGLLASFSATVTGGSGSASYSWSIKLAGLEVLSGEVSTIDFIPEAGGVYVVGLTVDSSGSSDTDTFEFTVIGDLGNTPFKSDIVWLATAGITKGCNKDGTEFCPDGQVTRGQMAAFLVRALGLTDDGGGNLFGDDDASIFEADIDRLATAGITKGCNPSEGNTKFCPNDPVTRGQMAAFLVRALSLTDNGGGNLFTDDDGSIFENNIDILATAGITKGCNPSEGNTKFCPDGTVTRGQMAAFLHRAESWLP